MATLARAQEQPVVRGAVRSPYRRNLLGQFLLYGILIIGLSVTLVPFVWMISSSFKTATEIRRTPPTFFPENPTLTNYQKLLSDPELPLLRFYGNSAFVAVANTLTTLFTSALLGYLFAKFRFPGKQALFGFFLLTMMIPSQLTMIPGYLILLKLGLTNNLWGLVLPSFLDAFGIFMMKQFVESVPNELLDAARIDGASEWRIFFEIVVPQLGAPLATLGTLHFMGIWNAYLWPMVVITLKDRRTLPVILTWYSTAHSNQQNMVMAASVLVIVPILFVYFIFQRWIVRGFAHTGFK
jgi:multiple sugar transport system permease protein